MIPSCNFIACKSLKIVSAFLLISVNCFTVSYRGTRIILLLRVNKVSYVSGFCPSLMRAKAITKNSVFNDRNIV